MTHSSRTQTHREETTSLPSPDGGHSSAGRGMSRLGAILISACCCALPTWDVRSQETAELTVDEAVEESLGREELAESRESRLRALEAARESELLWPNPTFSFDHEQSWDDGKVVTDDFFVLEQALPIWGARQLRARAAEQQQKAADAAESLRILEIRLETERAFYQTLRARKELEAARVWERRVVKSVERLEEQRRADAASRYAVERMRALLDETRATVAGRRAEWVDARGELASRTGRGPSRKSTAGETASTGGEPTDRGTPGGEWRATGRLRPEKPPEFAILEKRLSEHPELEKLRARAEQQAELRRARKRSAIPTPAVRGGYQRLDGPIHGFVAGLSLNLPLFHRNEPGRRAAGERSAELKTEARLERRRRVEQLRAAYRSASARIEAARRYRSDALPRAKELVERARERRDSGEATVADLVDAHRAFYDKKVRALELDWEARDRTLELRRLAGGYP